MKKLTLLFAVFFAAFYSNAQSVAINTDGSNGDASAMLDIKSTTKGFLMPRLTTAQRTAIVAPANGLLVYDTDTKTHWFYNGVSWINSYSAGGSGSSWNLSGNGSTNPAANFIGTTDGQALNFRVNNRRYGKLDLSRNIFWGDSAGAKTTSQGNIAIGARSLYSNTTGAWLVAIGDSALYNNGSYNGLVGLSNTAIGSKSLRSNTTGSNNTAVGFYSLYRNTTGIHNTALGSSALGSTTTGSSNVAVGSSALESNTIGGYNIAVGLNALTTNISGAHNIAIGGNSVFSNTTGISNIGIGSNSLHDNTTGTNNTALGNKAGETLVTGGGNTLIGSQANVATPGMSNSTAIGYDALVNASNKVRIGNTNVTVIEGQVPFSSPSDGRFKTNVKEEVKGLDFIMKLRPVVYNFESSRYDAFISGGVLKTGNQQNDIERIRQSGFIAQEVETAAKQSGYDFNGVKVPTSDHEAYSVSYSQFVVPLVKAMQEQQQQIEILKKQIEDLRKILASK